LHPLAQLLHLSKLGPQSWDSSPMEQGRLSIHGSTTNFQVTSLNVLYLLPKAHKLCLAY